MEIFLMSIMTTAMALLEIAILVVIARMDKMLNIIGQKVDEMHYDQCYPINKISAIYEKGAKK